MSYIVQNVLDAVRLSDDEKHLVRILVRFGDGAVVGGTAYGSFQHMPELGQQPCVSVVWDDDWDGWLEPDATSRVRGLARLAGSPHCEILSLQTIHFEAHMITHFCRCKPCMKLQQEHLDQVVPRYDWDPEVRFIDWVNRNYPQDYMKDIIYYGDINV